MQSKMPFRLQGKVRAQRSRAAWQSGLSVTISNYLDWALFKPIETPDIIQAILKLTPLQWHAEKHTREF